MGWTSSTQWYNQSKMIEYLISEERTGPNLMCMAHQCKGNILWIVWQSTKERGGKSWIECTLIRKFGYEEYGYKDMEESMHPYYYNCPLSYLKMANDGIHEEWRARVKAHWDNLKAIRALQRGSQVFLKWDSVNPVTISNTRPLRGTYKGVYYRQKEKQLAPLVVYQEPAVSTGQKEAPIGAQS